ncbi:hypothetical protein BJ138DRAFT_1166801 [Hygrophoropsis aurantiaca]|uniref:Uncharacterized protein n=1 Tax=Hygrophoropsis aurantiaca TaxID=72124 RepID=A0ACB7ZT07_9AGAM|nr:hypothetical protein BJ138DRAFT_1166801 [Hygrophoropsis aurantiaca]
MATWNLPGQTKTTWFKSTLAKSFAYSRAFNKRNLEYQWYSLFCQILTDLVDEFPNIFVVPQFPSWVREEDFNALMSQEAPPESGPDGGHVTFVELPNRPHTRAYVTPAVGQQPMHLLGSQTEPGEDDQVLDGADASFDSSATEPAKDAANVLIDFALVHVMAEHAIPRHPRYGGWLVTEVNIPVIIEQKRFTSRTLENKALHDGIGFLLDIARKDLYEQAAHLFLQFERMESVIAIATCGPYWSNVILRRGNVRVEMSLIQDGNWIDAKVNDTLKWPEAVSVEDGTSETRWKQIYKALKAMPRMELP